MRGFYIFLFFVASLLLHAQTSSMSASLKMQIANKRESGEWFNLIVQANIEKLKQAQLHDEFHVNYYSENIASINCSLETLSYLIERKIITYAEYPVKRILPLNDTMQVRNRLLAVKTGELPLSQAYDGEGVLLGIIDTGIDFTHPDLQDSLGNTRVKYLWDQAAVSGPLTPAPFNYGIEWNETEINASLCTHTDFTYWGHGTHVTGIASGNGLANGKHQGVASKSDIIFVAFDFNRVGFGISDAVKYIFDKADELGKPCVINASLGDYYGSHDGTDLETLMINSLVKNIPGRAMVAAAGNAGGVKYHTKTQVSGNDTLFTWLNNGSNTLDYWCYADTSQVKNIQFSIGANYSDYFDLGRLPFRDYSLDLSSVITDTLYYNGKRIGIVKTVGSINASGIYERYVQILSDNVTTLWRVETKGTGIHHAWNFDFLSAGLPQISQYPNITKYVMPDTMYSIVSGFQCSDEIITVANYDNLRFYYDVNDSLHDNGQTVGQISFSSSSGPTRDGRQKPDIAASGQFIFSTAVLAMLPSMINGAPETVAKGGMHVRGGGTSAASPIVAGLAALYMQKNKYATNREIKQAIIYCAYTDDFTGTALPNYKFGYGKLDGYNAMQCGEHPLLAESYEIEKYAKLFPNPFSEKITIELAEESLNNHLDIYSSTGAKLVSLNFTGKTYELESQGFKYYHGLLLMRISNAKGKQLFKVIKE